jgi:hypothetical protein
VEGCEGETDPKGAELDQMASDLKDLHDFISYAPDVLCKE